jgi:hypothetical protein
MVVDIFLLIAVFALVGGVISVALILKRRSQRLQASGNNKWSVAIARSVTGLLAVAFSDAAIVVAALWGIRKTDEAQVVPLLTSAFTAVTAITTAFFGIRAVANTAREALEYSPPGPPGAPGPTGPEGPTGPKGNSASPGEAGPSGGKQVEDEEAP